MDYGGQVLGALKKNPGEKPRHLYFGWVTEGIGTERPGLAVTAAKRRKRKGEFVLAYKTRRNAQ